MSRAATARSAARAPAVPDDEALLRRYAASLVEGTDAVYHDLPGALVRRLYQAVAFHLARQFESRGTDITPMQYSVMAGIYASPGIEQGALAERIQYDKATVGGVVDRLEAKDLVRRSQSPHDRRVRLLSLSAAGKRLVRKVAPGILAAQEEILEPLDASERAQFASLLAKLVAHHRGETAST